MESPDPDLQESQKCLLGSKWKESFILFYKNTKTVLKQCPWGTVLEIIKGPPIRRGHIKR